MKNLLTNTSMSRGANLVVAISISLLCFLITYIFLGFYYTDYQSFVSGLFSGKLTPGVPFRSLYFITNFGISYIYSYLYEAAPKIEWLSWFYCAYSFISCCLGLFLIATLLPGKVPLKIKIFLMFVIYVAVFADNHIHFICSHIAYMTCGVSLLALVCLFKSRSAISAHWKAFVLLNIFFTVGTLTRIETGTACLLLLAPFSLFYHQDIKQCIILLFYPLLLVSFLSIAVNMEIRSSKEFYLQVEPDIEAQYENRGNKVPLSLMKTHNDTVLYETATNIMWSDPNVISSKFLRSLILPEKLIFTDSRQWSRVASNISEMSVKYWYLVGITVLLALAIFFQCDFRGSLFKLLCWLVFEFSFWVLVITQTYIYKLNDRSFTPYISLFILCHIILLITNMTARISGRVYAIFPFLFMLLTVQLYVLTKEAKNLKQDLLVYQSNYEKIKKIAFNKYLVLNSTAADYICLSNIPLHPFDFSAFKKIYVIDGSVIPFIPYYKCYLEKECNCDIYAYPDFYNYLKSIHDDVVIVYNPQRMELVSNYLKEIHHYYLPAKLIDSTSLVKSQKDESRGNFEQLAVYELDK